MRLIFPLFVLMLAVSGIFSSCSDEPDCDFGLPSDSVNIVFYDIDSLEPVIKTFVEVGAIGADTIFYSKNDTLVSVFSLPLNPNADTSTFYFLSGLSEDVIKVKYKRNLKWISERCGPFMGFEIQSVESTFDSLSIVNEYIDESIDENIQVFN